MRKALGSLSAALLVSLSGCGSATHQQPPESVTPRSLKTPAERLQAIVEAVEHARTIRVRVQQEITLQYRKDIPFRHKTGSAGVLLLGETGTLSLTVENGRGGPYRVVSNGTVLWVDNYDPSANAQKQIQGSTTVHELSSGVRRTLAYGTIMGTPDHWRDVYCFPWSERKLTVSAPTDIVFLQDDQSALSYSIQTVYVGDSTPKVFKVTVWYEPATSTIKKRSISLDQHGQDPEVTVTEIYDEFALNVDVPGEAFLIPPAPTPVDATRQKLAILREALDSYLIHNHAYPTAGQGLDALLQQPSNPPASNWQGPYVKDGQCLQDGWGSRFNYRCPRLGIDPTGYELSSSGPDKKPNTPDDIRR